MSNQINFIPTVSVIGTDGHVPLHNPNESWKIRSYNEIYWGKVGKNKIVPNVDDYLVRITDFTFFKVVRIDAATLIPEIEPIYINTKSSETSLTRRGNLANKAYLDTTIDPYQLTISCAYFVGGTMLSYAILFKGTDISTNGHVLSHQYNSIGEITSHKVLLEKVAIDSHDNIAIKTMRPTSTRELLRDGETITAVFYNDQGSVIHTDEFTVINTNFIRPVNLTQRYISQIEITSPFISPTEPDVIQCPSNLTLDDLNLFGRVKYSNGDRLNLPLNGSKFKLMNRDVFFHEIRNGAKYPVTLRYTLSDEETTNQATDDHTAITRQYTIKIVDPIISYQFHLIPFIELKGGVYHLNGVLYNYRDGTYVVCNELITVLGNGNYFDNQLYNQVQSLLLGVEVNKINPVNLAYVKQQTFEVVLNEPQQGRSNWTYLDKYRVPIEQKIVKATNNQLKMIDNQPFYEWSLTNFTPLTKHKDFDKIKISVVGKGSVLINKEAVENPIDFTTPLADNDIVICAFMDTYKGIVTGITVFTIVIEETGDG